MAEARRLEFDAAAYRQQYPDLNHLPDESLAIHFHDYGEREGRFPTALFDPRYYADGAGVPVERAADDYRYRPRLEADPHPLFDLRHYEAQAGYVFDPVEHYAAEGWRQGFDPHPVFSTRHYISQLDGSPADGRDPLSDFVLDGWRRGLEPHPLFATDYYMANAPDVVHSGRNPLIHFLSTGGLELRVHHPLFDPGWYVECTGCDQIPLLHYLAAGGSNDPSPLFNTRWYLRHSDSARQSDDAPLVHWMTEGAREGSPFSSLALDEVVLAMLSRGEVTGAATLMRHRYGSPRRHFVLSFTWARALDRVDEGWVLGGLPGVVTSEGTLVGADVVERSRVVHCGDSVAVLHDAVGTASATTAQGVVHRPVIVGDDWENDPWTWFSTCIPALAAASDGDRPIVISRDLDRTSKSVTRFLLGPAELVFVQPGVAQQVRDALVVSGRPQIRPDSPGPANDRVLLVLDIGDPFDDANRAELVGAVVAAGGEVVDTAWGPLALAQAISRCGRLVAASALPVVAYLARRGSTIVSLDDDLPAHALDYMDATGLIVEMIELAVAVLPIDQHARPLLRVSDGIVSILGGDS